MLFRTLKYILHLFLLITLLANSNMLLAAEEAATPDAAATPTENEQATTAFTPSSFQQNAQSLLATYTAQISPDLKNKEIEDLNFSMHIIHFDQTKEDPKNRFIKEYARIYCNPSYEGNLPECGQNANNLDSPRLYANLRPSSIFDPNNYDAENGPLLAKALIRTIVNPFPNTKINQMLADAKGTDTMEKQMALAELIAPQAQLMLANNSFNEILTKRIRYEGKASMIETLRDESTRRLTDNTWITNIQNMSTKSLMLELLQIEAFKLWTEYHKFLQSERLEGLIAALLAAQSTGGASQMAQDLEDTKKENKKNAANAKRKLQSRTGASQGSSGSSDSSSDSDSGTPSADDVGFGFKE